jgi:hypothetical protein
MKQLIIIALLFIGLSVNAQTKTKSSTGYYGTGSNPSSTRVNGYSKSNGTYVSPHYKTTNNNTQKDNYNVNPNYNYHNGKTGTRKAKY